MATITYSVDTSTRQTVVTVDGQIINPVACRFDKWIDFDGDQQLRVSYIMETKNADGLVERREFFLADPEDEAVFASSDNGLASRKFEGDPKDVAVRSDINKFMEDRKKNRRSSIYSKKS